MKSFEDLKKQSEKPQDSLQKGFLSGKISFEEFRDKWFELDQSGNHTEQATSNILMLECPKIIEKVSSLSVEYQNAYFKMLSISYFHKAQSSLNINDFRKAYKYAQENSSDETYVYWLNYVKGTLAYFQRDINLLREIVSSMKDEGNNKKILLQLLESLNKGDDPESCYLNVYSNY